ncbi:hypothetical protein EYC80_000436 [Monilinia laxa]|nr:hypothetical protein EYC80_000436 [Monilinia laxa]
MTQLVVTLWYRSPELLLGEERYGKSVDMWSVGCNEVDQLSKIFELLGLPTEATWPSFKRLPNARSLRLPKNPNPATQGSVLRSKFPFLTSAGSSLLSSLLSLNPAKRPSAQEVLEHEYFKEDPKMKSRDMFPTFPSKAGLEKKRRRGTPDAPQRGEAPKGLGGVLDFSGVLSERIKMANLAVGMGQCIIWMYILRGTRGYTNLSVYFEKAISHDFISLDLLCTYSRTWNQHEDLLSSITWQLALNHSLNSSRLLPAIYACIQSAKSIKCTYTPKPPNTITPTQIFLFQNLAQRNVRCMPSNISSCFDPILL